MEWAALITWILTAGGGFVMFAIWLARGGMRQRGDDVLVIRPPLIVGHFLLAAAGLVVWIIYLAKDKEGLAWLALGILGAVALLGFAMFFIWAKRRQTRMAPAMGADAIEPPEQHFPVPIVALHGVLAVATVVLVFLTAVGVGGD